MKLLPCTYQGFIYQEGRGETRLPPPPQKKKKDKGLAVAIITLHWILHTSS